MKKVKHVANASLLITEAFDGLPKQFGDICKKLRAIVLKADKNIIEDWKWGPNFYLDGMVCAIWGFKNHASITFFQGALLKDPKKLLSANPGNLHNRHIKFTDVKQIDAKVITAFIKESVANNKKGNKILVAKDKTVVVPEELKKAMIKNKVMNTFEAMSYSKRKDYAEWVSGAKQEETKKNRIEKIVANLKLGLGMNDKYKK